MTEQGPAVLGSAAKNRVVLITDRTIFGKA